MKIFLSLLAMLIYTNSIFSAEVKLEKSFLVTLKFLETDLKAGKLIKARDYLNIIQYNGLKKEEWLKLRDLIHRYPQIGYDVLYKFDRLSPMKENKVDLAIKKADELMTQKKFYEAAFGYQKVIKFITSSPKFKNGRNIKLYWSLIHSLARAFYGLKQYEDADLLYSSIPQTYPYFRQVQFEKMWNNYKSDKLDFVLGSIATMSSGYFSKILEPEVYLVQYYTYKRLCRDSDAEFIKKRVKTYHQAIQTIDLHLGNWIKKDVNTLIMKQVLLSGNINDDETTNLRKKLDEEKKIDYLRLKKEFDLVSAYLELDNGTNANLKPLHLNSDENVKNREVLFPIEDTEQWGDEIGNYKYVSKDLCR